MASIESTDQLPLPGTASEKAPLDFKAKPTDDRFEIAKDIAAFSNAIGGTILIGAAAVGEHLSKYLPFSKEEAAKTHALIEQSVRDRCKPAPIFDIATIPKDGGYVIAINIWPFPSQPIGVELKKGDKGQDKLEGLLLFPMRVGSHTRSITPDQLPMFMEPRLRRIAVCLHEAIGQPLGMYSKYSSRGEGSIWFETWQLKSIDLIGNSITVYSQRDDGKEFTVAVPPDGIDSAYRSEKGWHVLLRGKISTVVWGTGHDDRTEVVMLFDPNQ
jgi:Putative DNA-binding domain